MPSTLASPQNSDWYEVEHNTATLVQAVLAHLAGRSLSGDDIWYLAALTWITAHRGQTTEHWRNLKIPSLEHLFHAEGSQAEDMEEVIAEMPLPSLVAAAALKRTGFVNAYRVYRNSFRDWCTVNGSALRRIINRAKSLSRNDQDRFDLALSIAALPPIPSPSGERHMSAENLITPLIACIDPYSRFPIVNGEKGVYRRLRRLGLLESSLEDRIRGLVGIIGQFGLKNAFAVDTMPESLIEKITKKHQERDASKQLGGSGTNLPDFDDAERQSVLMAKTVIYRKRHNRMTTRLKLFFEGLKFTQGNTAECRFDALAANYDKRGRDLLIEVKPDPDLGSIRIAIGQLLDYRRFLPRQAATDLALLTISRPSQSHLDLLHELQITALWFADEDCEDLRGSGKSWKSVQALSPNGS